jgi:hypothetical protein
MNIYEVKGEASDARRLHRNEVVDDHGDRLQILYKLYFCGKVYLLVNS